MIRIFSFSIIALIMLSTVFSCSTESTPAYTLTTTANPTEGGDIVPDSGTFDEGEAVSIQAIPADGWVFVRWEQDLSSTANPMNVTMNRDYNVVGVFEQRMHTLSIDVEGEGTVSETVVQQKTTDYPEGTLVELEAVPDENWSFSHWKGGVSGSENPVGITVDKPKSIVAIFATIPSVNTSSVESITEDSAQSGGEVTDDGGASVTARGVCWSTSQSPTTDDYCTSDGEGTGSFTSSLTGLNPDTHYNVRAFSTNSVGTAYGNQRNFKTDYFIMEIVDVTNPVTGRTWMDRNLGARRAAISSTDPESFGDLYQWGRAADGHEKRNSGTSSVLSSTDQPGHDEFITTSSSPYDWRSSQNDNLWQGVDGINNPCPDGYRLPTEVEWEADRQSWSSATLNNNATGAFSSPLKLPVSGGRVDDTGEKISVGSFGFYWSSTISGSNSRYITFLESNAGMLSGFRAFGLSVRCIKD